MDQKKNKKKNWCLFLSSTNTLYDVNDVSLQRAQAILFYTQSESGESRIEIWDYGRSWGLGNGKWEMGLWGFGGNGASPIFLLPSQTSQSKKKKKKRKLKQIHFELAC